MISQIEDDSDPSAAYLSWIRWRPVVSTLAVMDAPASQSRAPKEPGEAGFWEPSDRVTEPLVENPSRSDSKSLASRISGGNKRLVSV